jgi:hypothetical protein
MSQAGLRAVCTALLLLSACNGSTPVADAKVDVISTTDHAIVDGRPGQGEGRTPDKTPQPDGPKPAPVWKPVSGAGPAVVNFSATLLLADGRVLVAGGYDYVSPTQTVPVYRKQAWLYQPDTNSWVSAGEMKEARAYHSASLLPDGRVLIAGGYDGSKTHATTELFDPKQPAASAWSAGPALPGERMSHAAVTLTDGQILLAGGDGSWPDILSSFVIYKPSTNSFQSPAFGLSKGRATIAATLLLNGKVLLAGGDDGSSAFSNIMETFDPGTGAVTLLKATMSDKKSAAFAFTLPSGKVLITAGYAFAYPPRDDLYDPVADSVLAVNHPNGSARGSAAARLADGRVIVAGGFETAQEKKVRVFTEKGMSWETLPDLLHARAYLALVTLKDGSVLAVGGRTGSTYPSEAERLYYP